MNFSSLDLMPPPFSWIEIPAGSVTRMPGIMGGQQRFDVPAFTMAKYPVTNAQFAKFVEAGGYARKQWWTEEGWNACQQGLEEVELLHTSQPTGIPWSEP